MKLKQVHAYRTGIDFDLLDAGNVLHHPNYLVLCERARSAALTDAGYPASRLWKEKYAFAVLECHAKFLKAIEPDQNVIVLTTMESCSKARFQVNQKIVLDHTDKPFSLADAPMSDFLFEANFLLGMVTVNPLKAARVPEQLALALGLNQ